MDLTPLKQLLVEDLCLELPPEAQRILRVLASASRPLGAKELANEHTKAKDAASNIRQQIKSLRSHIALFSATPSGRRHSFAVEVLGGEANLGYSLNFNPRSPETKKFWRPYLQAKKPVLIVYTELQFFRLDEDVFVRHLDVNDPVPTALWEKLDWLPRTSLRHSSHFVSSGETDAVLQLTRWFERNGVETEHLPAHQWAAHDVSDRALILLGNKRTFPDLAPLFSDSGLVFQMQEHHVENTAPQNGEQPCFPDAFRSAEFIHGVLARFDYPDRDGLVTAFASNHGRFFEAAARALTSDEPTRRFWAKLGVESAAFPPERFEAIGEARVTAFDHVHRTHSIQWVASRPTKAVDDFRQGNSAELATHDG